MVTRRSIVTASVVALGLLMATWGYTWTVNKRMYLSFSGPVSLPGVTLPAGTYTFQRPAEDIHVVRISSRDESQVYLTTFTQLINRPTDLPDSQHVMLGEPSQGRAPRIKAWFPLGERQGHEFVYTR